MATVTVIPGGLEAALKEFKSKVRKSGILADARRRESYVGPSMARKQKSDMARKRGKRNGR